MTGCGIMSSVWGMMLQRGSTIKVSIELPVHVKDVAWKLKVAQTLHGVSGVVQQ